MASNPPGSCCTQTNFHEGSAKGSFAEIFGLDSYKIGEQNGNDKVIVILTDIYGHKYNNVLLVADEFAAAGYHVLVPDILFGDPYSAGAELSAWLPNHSPEKTAKVIETFLSGLKKEYNPKFTALVGYCFGAKYAIQQIAENGLADAAAAAHPSFVTIEEIKAIKKPLIISAAEVDPIFTDELRHQTEAALKKIGARYQIDLFSGVSHGYSVRGDVKDPVQKYAKEKTLCDQVYFFNSLAK